LTMRGAASDGGAGVPHEIPGGRRTMQPSRVVGTDVDG
jgi:hypothetical protein